MSLSRYAPHRIRATYLRALKELPIPTAPPEAVDPSELTVLGRAWISKRRIVLGTLAEAPRLWLAFTDHDPPLIGYVTGLVVGEPELWVFEDAHRAWATEGGNAAALKRAAAHVWFEVKHPTGYRECEG